MTTNKVTGVPGVNPIRRIRRIDVLDRDDQKHSYDRTPPDKSFKAALKKELKSPPTPPANSTFQVKI